MYFFGRYGQKTIIFGENHHKFQWLGKYKLWQQSFAGRLLAAKLFLDVEQSGK